MKKLTTLLVCLLLPGLMAQQPPEMEKPGEHHQHLKQWVGTWDVKSKMHMIPGQVIEGTYVEVARLQEGGFWLISDVRGKVLGMDFHGHCVLGYEKFKKQYSSLWVDSFASIMLVTKGRCENDGKKNILVGTSFDPIQKRDVPMKQVTEFKDANTKVFKMFAVEGKKDILLMEAVAKRRLGKPKKDAKFKGPFTHTIDGLGAVHYYLGGPQQARPPEGKFKPGTRVRLVRGAGSYSVVQSETGITAHVATATLKKIAK